MHDPVLQLLQSMRADAEVLTRAGSSAFGQMLGGYADALDAATEDYTTWLSESDAMLRSGWTRARLRGHFPQWEQGGNARRVGRGDRRYRQVVVPKAPGESAAAHAGILAARALKQAS